jgi:Arc/MetJ-type ribon-helix-helix transcriptional regulator
MNVQIPVNFNPAVEKLITEGRFRNAGEIVAEGIKLVLMREELERDVQAGLDDLDAGNRIEANKVYAEARRRIKAIADGQAQ